MQPNLDLSRIRVPDSLLTSREVELNKQLMPSGFTASLAQGILLAGQSRSKIHFSSGFSISRFIRFMN